MDCAVWAFRSGKSTLLRAACGLLPQKGICFERICADGTREVLEDATVCVPPHLRGLRWAPQHASLFPHMTAQENVEFAARTAATEIDPVTASNDIEAAVEMFRLHSLAFRAPEDLSGGERQRVSLARAFAAPGCRLLLLDEPFNGVDRTLRDALIPQMRAWLGTRGIPCLSVTHDVEEALQLGAHVVVLEDGRVTNEGPAAEVLGEARERMLSNLRATATD